MPGLSRRQRQADGFQVTQFTHQDHIRVLPQCRTQGRRKTVGVAMHLALVDQGPAGLVDEFDGVFQGEDVLAPVLVEVIDQRRQGGRLARTGGPGHQHQAARQLGDTLEHRAQPEVFQALDLGGDVAKHRAHATRLLEHIHPESPDTGQFEGEIRFKRCFEILLLVLVEQRAEQIRHVRG